MNITYLNKHFRFVYQPNKLLTNHTKTRFLIGAGSLGSYLGKCNAETVQKTALNSKTDKVTLKFRKYGKIDVYVK